MQTQIPDQLQGQLAAAGLGGEPKQLTDAEKKSLSNKWNRIAKRLRTRVGEEVFSSWFGAVELESYDEGRVRVSVPTKFLSKWIDQHYKTELLECCDKELKGAESLSIEIRKPKLQNRTIVDHGENGMPASGAAGLSHASSAAGYAQVLAAGRTSVGGFDGSPLDPKCTFESFATGTSNGLAHAASKQIAETLLEQPLRFNPLYIHSNVGLGKTHLLHAIAWEVKRRNPNAQLLYLTAEKFRYNFVEAVKSQEAIAFKDRLRSIDILLIDDMEFLYGPKTEVEFDHTLNALLDSGKQVVVASAKAPSQLDRLDLRMRSRLSGGLVTEILSLDYELRLSILEKRAADKRADDPTFQVSREVLEYLAEKLTENARELEGAINRLYAACHLQGEPITMDATERTMRDLLRGAEPKRIKIDEILRVISKHYGVSRGDLLSQRRHRSIVWPRQIGMFLAKTLTSRSLPEIGRRFGGRDHTTVLHAIRKIDGILTDDPSLRDEIEDLKRLLNN